MNLCLRPVVGMVCGPKSFGPVVSKRTNYFKFERVYTPPLEAPKESPYIVGPYLKPKYLKPKYLTGPIMSRHDDHLNYFIYKPREVLTEESRTVKLLLLDDVEGLGVAGQVVDAPYRLGASRLIAMRKAEYATDFALKIHKFGPRTIESASSALSPRTARLLRNNIFSLPCSSDTTIKPWHISLSLRLAGCNCPIEAIEESSITNLPANEDGTFMVQCTIRINNHERCDVRFKFNPIIN